MSTEAKKGITVKVDAGLHAEVTQYLGEHGMTMGEFVTLALTNELHPKIQIKEEKNMENRTTLAFQVSEDLFLRIKEYLQRNNMTQKEFVIHLRTRTGPGSGYARGTQEDKGRRRRRGRKRE